MAFTFAETLGFFGLALLLLAFVLNHFKKIRRFTFFYNFLNLVGSLMLAYYAYDIGATVFFWLEIIWAGFAVYYLVNWLANHGIMHTFDGFIGDGSFDAGLQNVGKPYEEPPKRHNPWFK